MKSVNYTKYFNFIFTELLVIIHKYFPNSFINIDMSDDGKITINVYTTYSPKRAFEKLKQFDEEYWLDKCDEYNNLCIYVEVM